MKNRWKNKLLAWWYFSIAIGFILLAANRWMLGEGPRLIIIRLGIAVGFLVLGILTLRTRS